MQYKPLLAIVSTEFRRTYKTMHFVILPAIINITLYIIIFVNTLGSHIKIFQVVSYKEFVVPGLIIMTVITSVFGQTSGSLFCSKQQAYLQELISSPVSASTVILGYTLGALFRGAVIAFISFIISYLLTKIIPQEIFLSLFILLAAAILFALLGITVALLSNKQEIISAAQMYVLLPLTLLSGVYYSTAVLSDFWKNFTKLDPVFYIVNCFRQSYSGLTEVNMSISLEIIIPLIFILFFLNIFIYKNMELRSL